MSVRTMSDGKQQRRTNGLQEGRMEFADENGFSSRRSKVHNGGDHPKGEIIARGVTIIFY